VEVSGTMLSGCVYRERPTQRGISPAIGTGSSSPGTLPGACTCEGNEQGYFCAQIRVLGLSRE